MKTQRMKPVWGKESVCPFKKWLDSKRGILGRAIGFQVVVFSVLTIFLSSLTGCNDPDALGRFRAVPVTNVILDELGVVDEEPSVFSGAREPKSEDLEVVAREYVIGPGDVLNISIYELFAAGMEWIQQRQVSDTGRLTRPEGGTILAAGRTELELTEDIRNRLSPLIIKDPKVSIVVVGSRERVYSISGALSSPGRYPIGEVDFRISEALAQAGGIPQINADYAYIIRNVEEEALTGMESGNEDMGLFAPVLPGEKVLPKAEVSVPAEPAVSPEAEEPPKKSNGAEDELLESIKPMNVLGKADVSERGEQGRMMLVSDDPILAEQVLEGVQAEKSMKAAADMAPGKKPFTVIRKDGRFELSPEGGVAAEPEGAEGMPAAESKPGSEPPWRRSKEEMGQAGQVQEVIRVDLKALRHGDQSQNIVIRPGDDIQVPYNAAGVFYITGQVLRPGPYNLSGSRMTLKRAIATSGPLTSLAWPSRCEITRMTGENTEVVYRVNLEKLLMGAAPDVLIKPDDIINVGSHPVARWVAVVRQSFRSTYGFGFVYDRNLADKDFGH